MRYIAYMSWNKAFKNSIRVLTSKMMGWLEGMPSKKETLHQGEVVEDA